MSISIQLKRLKALYKQLITVNSVLVIKHDNTSSIPVLLKRIPAKPFKPKHSRGPSAQVGSFIKASRQG
jgi:hypothetical protein